MDLEVKRILLLAGMAVFVIIWIVRIKNNIKNGKKWWDGLNDGSGDYGY